MRDALARYVRRVQVEAPFLFDLKNGLQRGLRRRLGKPFDADFKVLGVLDLPKDSLILDIGGNRGQSIDAVRLVLPQAPIVSFEPNPQLAADLRTLFAADERVTVHNVALSDAPGELTLHVPYYNGWMFDGLASLDRSQADGWLSSQNLAGFDPKKVEIRTVTCRVATLDGFGLDGFGLGDPVFVKIDVQGLEPQVLDGGREMLAKARPIVMLEDSDEVDMLEHLPDGYEPAHWDGERLKRGRARTVNTFYLPGEVAARF